MKANNPIYSETINEVEAMTGAKVIAITKEDSSFNSDFVLLDNNGVITQAFITRDINGKISINARYDSNSVSEALAYLNMTEEELSNNIEFIGDNNPDNTTPETSETMNTGTKTITVKRSDWNETAKRLECAGWFYIGTPTATGKTIYRRVNSEIEIIIEEDVTDTPETMNEATKSVNDIMNQANRLMSECNAKRNYKRADAIRKIAFRYFDNIRACAGSFNSNDDAEYNKQYSRAQYMTA